MSHSVFEYNYNHVINLSEIDATEFAKLKVHKRIFYTLKLNNLERISSPECRKLIQFKGSIIELAGLKSISLDSTEILSKFKGALILGIEQIDPGIASILAKHAAVLSLPRLEDCDDLSMQLLSSYQGNILQLDSIKKISVNQAKFLANFKGGFLSLDGLIEISVPVVKSLSKYGGFLFLSALDKIPLNIAKELVKHKGSISLNGVTNITDEVAEIFSTKEGLYLDLKGIKKLSFKAQTFLQNARAIVSLSID